MPTSVNRAPVYDGCRTQRYGPACMTSWPGRVATSTVNDAPSTRIEYQRKAIPARMRANPKMNSAVRPLLIAASGNANESAMAAVTDAQTELITAILEPESCFAELAGGRRRYPIHNSDPNHTSKTTQNPTTTVVATRS